MSEYRSVSQYNSYKSCPYAYKLERIDGAWQRPAAWFPHGTAVHAAAEAWERSGRTMPLEDAQGVFKTEYTAGIGRYCEDTPNFDCWYDSGPYKAGEEYTSRAGKFYVSDIERRFHQGLEQVEKYISYYQGKGKNEVIWIAPDNTPAIELEFHIELGDVKVRGYIDQVIDHPEREVIVRDIKTGTKPGDDFQLAVYGEAVRQLAGVDVLSGDYWMARKGKPTEAYDLSPWTSERLTDAFGEMDAAVKAGDFPAKPDPDKCRRCSVSTSCSFFMA